LIWCDSGALSYEQVIIPGTGFFVCSSQGYNSAKLIRFLVWWDPHESWEKEQSQRNSWEPNLNWNPEIYE